MAFLRHQHKGWCDSLLAISVCSGAVQRAPEAFPLANARKKRRQKAGKRMPARRPKGSVSTRGPRGSFRRTPSAMSSDARCGARRRRSTPRIPVAAKAGLSRGRRSSITARSPRLRASRARLWIPRRSSTTRGRSGSSISRAGWMRRDARAEGDRHQQEHLFHAALAGQAEVRPRKRTCRLTSSPSCLVRSVTSRRADRRGPRYRREPSKARPHAARASPQQWYNMRSAPLDCRRLRGLTFIAVIRSSCLLVPRLQREPGGTQC
jgi:hypothetical protein